MKVFFASSWYDREAVEYKANQMRQLGHEVTSQWHVGDAEGRHFVAGATTVADRARNDSLVHNDMYELQKADMLIYIPWKNRIGEHVELGMALAWEIPICLIGERLGLYSYACVIHHYDTWEQFLEAEAATSQTAYDQEVRPTQEVRKGHRAEAGVHDGRGGAQEGISAG